MVFQTPEEFFTALNRAAETHPQDKGYQTPEEFFAALDGVADTHPNDALVAHGKRLCPICQNPMRVEVLFRKAIDVCPEHGKWLDLGELEQIMSVIKSAIKAVDPVVHQQAMERARAWGRIEERAGPGYVLALLMDLMDFHGPSAAHSDRPWNAR
jgi:Zn-finger nucleic acid-binding protein